MGRQLQIIPLQPLMFRMFSVFLNVVIFKNIALDVAPFGSTPISGADKLCPYFDEIAQFCY
jgi:hypothetical protein